MILVTVSVVVNVEVLLVGTKEGLLEAELAVLVGMILIVEVQVVIELVDIVLLVEDVLAVEKKVLGVVKLEFVKVVVDVEQAVA
jgi:hypothetical protein